MPTSAPRPAPPGPTPSFTPRTRLALLAVGAAAVATIHSARAAHAAARAARAHAAAAQPAPPRGAPDKIPTPAVLPPHAHFPAPWVGLVGSDSSASAFDPTHLTFAGDTATVWVRTQFPRDLSLGASGPPGVRAIDVSHQVRCAAGRARATGSMVLLGAAGDTLGERVAWDPRDWEPLDHVLTKVCRCVTCARRMWAGRTAGRAS